MDLILFQYSLINHLKNAWLNFTIIFNMFNFSSFIWVSSELKGYCEWKSESDRTIVHRLKRETYNLLHLSSVFLKLLYEQSACVYSLVNVFGSYCNWVYAYVCKSMRGLPTEWVCAHVMTPLKKRKHSNFYKTLESDFSWINWVFHYMLNLIQSNFLKRKFNFNLTERYIFELKP